MLRKSRFSAPHTAATPSVATAAEHLPAVEPVPPPTFYNQQLPPAPAATPFEIFDAKFISKIQRAWGRNFAYIRRKDLEGSQPRPQPQPQPQPQPHDAPIFAPPHSNVGTNLYVSGLPVDILEEDLHMLFSKQGKIKRVKLYVDVAGRKKGDALVSFHKSDVVDLCIALYNRRDIGDGYVIELSRAVVRGGDAAPAPAPPLQSPSLTEAEEEQIANQVEAVDAFLTSLL